MLNNQIDGIIVKAPRVGQRDGYIILNEAKVVKVPKRFLNGITNFSFRVKEMFKDTNQSLSQNEEISNKTNSLIEKREKKLEQIKEEARNEKIIYHENKAEILKDKNSVSDEKIKSNQRKLEDLTNLISSEENKIFNMKLYSNKIDKEYKSIKDIENFKRSINEAKNKAIYFADNVKGKFSFVSKKFKTNLRLKFLNEEKAKREIEEINEIIKETKKMKVQYELVKNQIDQFQNDDEDINLKNIEVKIKNLEKEIKEFEMAHGTNPEKGTANEFSSNSFGIYKNNQVNLIFYKKQKEMVQNCKKITDGQVERELKELINRKINFEELLKLKSEKNKEKEKKEYEQKRVVIENEKILEQKQIRKEKENRLKKVNEYIKRYNQMIIDEKNENQNNEEIIRNLEIVLKSKLLEKERIEKELGIEKVEKNNNEFTIVASRNASLKEKLLMVKRKTILPLILSVAIATTGAATINNIDKPKDNVNLKVENVEENEIKVESLKEQEIGAINVESIKPIEVSAIEVNKSPIVEAEKEIVKAPVVEAKKEIVKAPVVEINKEIAPELVVENEIIPMVNDSFLLKEGIKFYKNVEDTILDNEGYTVSENNYIKPGRNAEVEYIATIENGNIVVENGNGTKKVLKSSLSNIKDFEGKKFVCNGNIGWFKFDDVKTNFYPNNDIVKGSVR